MEVLLEHSVAGLVFVLHHLQLARVGVGVDGPVSPLEVAVARGAVLAVADVPGDTAEGDPMKVDGADRSKEESSFKTHAIN